MLFICVFPPLSFSALHLLLLLAPAPTKWLHGRGALGGKVLTRRGLFVNFKAAV